MKPSNTYQGWRGQVFLYGKSQEEVINVVPEETEKCDNCCSKESCGCGCYMTVVDFDRLDQQ